MTDEAKDFQLRDYPVTVCDGCINLNGKACNTPGCAFIRLTTPEIRFMLNQTQICPLVDGERLYTVTPIKND